MDDNRESIDYRNMMTAEDKDVIAVNKVLFAKAVTSMAIAWQHVECIKDNDTRAYTLDKRRELAIKNLKKARAFYQQIHYWFGFKNGYKNDQAEAFRTRYDEIRNILFPRVY